MASRIDNDLHVAGALSAQSLTVPAGSVSNAGVAAGAAIAATKLIHQQTIHYSQADGADIASAIVPVCTIYGATATIVAFEVVCLDAPSGGDKTFTVDLLSCAAGAATPATVLTGVVTYPNGTADCTVRPGTIATAALVDGQTLVVQVAASGSTGAQGQGLVVTITLRQDPQ